MIQTINPANEAILKTYDFLSPSSLESALQATHLAYSHWSQRHPQSRVELFENLAKTTRRHKSELARLITIEMGKPIVEAEAEVEKCILATQAYLAEFPGWLEEIPMPNKMAVVEVVPRPLGVIFAIMPWNFPAWQLYRFAIPTLLMGNTVLFKHAPNTFGCAELIQKIFIEAGFPTGVLHNVFISIEQVEKVIGDFRVKGVSLTGSGRAGRSVASLAGAALKRCVLELGGSDPYIILDDADLDLAIAKSVSARMLNAGQSCISGKRIIVTKKNYQNVVDGVTDKMRLYKMADPMDPSTRLGPLARFDLREQLHNQVIHFINSGAKATLGAELPKDKLGFYYPATVLTQLEMDDYLRVQEIFGPVACVVKANDEQHAIEIANNSVYGLGSAVFTRDLEKAKDLAKNKIQAGMVAINGMVRSDPAWPFGGINESGFGRELTRFGAYEFVNLKTIICD
jgi:succinate-semialdehyde dehydrogenase / glutarate-semialdehyde dehydrogenase